MDYCNIGHSYHTYRLDYKYDLHRLCVKMSTMSACITVPTDSCQNYHDSCHVTTTILEPPHSTSPLGHPHLFSFPPPSTTLLSPCLLFFLLPSAPPPPFYYPLHYYYCYYYYCYYYYCYCYYCYSTAATILHTATTSPLPVP